MKKQGICTPHPLATEIGESILKSGGTAIDAMIGAGSTLSVVYPHMTGIGGDALWMLFDGRVRTIMGFGQAGQIPPHVKNNCIPVRGVGSACTTAGAMASWNTARQISENEWGSTLPWHVLFEDAVIKAKSGVPVSEGQAFWIKQRENWLRQTSSINHLYLNKDGSLLKENDQMRQSDLATSFERLAKFGVDDFYYGELSEAIVEGFKEINCTLTKRDLAKTQAMEIRPLSIRYREGNYFNFPPPSQGYYTTQAMATLNQYPLTKFGDQSSLYYHVLIEAIKHCLLLRNQNLSDQKNINDQNDKIAPVEINLQRAQPWPSKGKAADTIWMSATDSQGRTACLMQSLFHDFGSGCAIGDTGIVWHNRGSSFNTSNEHPNCWAPGKRPAHTLNPSCYISDTGKQYFFGSQGGDGQPQTQLILATQLIDFNKTAENALRVPRFLLGRSFFDSNDKLKLEKDINPKVISELITMNHDVELIPPLSPYTGQAGVLIVENQNITEAVHDPRGQGNGIVF